MSAAQKARYPRFFIFGAAWPAAGGIEISKDQVLGRLRRVEGQIQGIQQMVETDRYCIDVLTQISTVTKALQSVPWACSTTTSGTASPTPSPFADGTRSTS